MADLEPIGYQLVITTFVFGFVALSTLVIRLWFRARYRKYDVSDLCLIAAMICAILQSAIQLILVFNFGYGKAKADIPAHMRNSLWPSKLAYINQMLFKLTTPLSKLSLCLLYRLMCSKSTDTVIRITRVAIWGTILLIVGAYGSALLITIFQFFNLITSVMVITLPIPTLIKFKGHRPEVKQLLGLILLGLVHTSLTIARFVIMFYPDPHTKTEPQYAHIMSNCLAVVEMDVGIWVATLVVMRPAFQAFYRIFHPNHRPEGSTSLYYGRSGSEKGGNSYHMRDFSARGKMREDEFHILETTEIQVTIAYLVFASPAHAALVKSVVVPNIWGEDAPARIEPGKRSWPNSGTPDLEHVLRKRCTEYAIDDNEARELYDKIKPGTEEDAILALFLTNLPNLQKLDVNLGIATDNVFFIAMLERVAQRVKPFGKIPWDPTKLPAVETFGSLESTAFSVPIDVMVKGFNDKYPNDPEYLMGDSESPPGLIKGPFAKLKPRSCAVEYIELRTSKLHKDNLQFLMNATIPGKLKTFNYEIGCTWAGCNVEHPAIMQSLEAHHNTLESLGLSHADFYPYQFDNDHEKLFPVSFTQFKTLKHLKVAPVFIWGHTGFSQQELWITRAHQQSIADEGADVEFVPNCLIPALEHVIQRKVQVFPNLKSLRIEFPLLAWKIP
ncbi:uncharacterized protein K460DRAFT_410052 [Cucurbitaria berberidis CBS 394.84]|uniref:Rhodopsin domain-containing protein n=1 Tax=Cucurbitaria berberidis CBS 394.84 TaxID=1168544 RepID=A0A9P4L381_9PLEO|nr:uncharacterized protein K460DRAFT_410052 [Cucurbitaria berberidis CBS 394.84]KAF1840636.1 hypothetical protein K460DRAFT_410052 [Cucurbitaria berberidis CBS 394.84]